LNIVLLMNDDPCEAGLESSEKNHYNRKIQQDEYIDETKSPPSIVFM
jgi:hypothetical protein